jgi:glucose-1-phosphate thymidylyltransferase
MSKKGILLSGGNGTRLLPLTSVVNKHLLGLNSKFIIDYPIETLKQLGCEDITIVLGGNHYSQVVGYLGDGSRYGLNFSYVYQAEPKGIAQAIALCKNHVSNSNFSVVLGDNIFDGNLSWNKNVSEDTAQIMLAKHPSLERFGVASLDDTGKIMSLEEKPSYLDNNYNNYAVSGCYLFTPAFFDYFSELKPSARGEYEVVSIIERYLKDNKLSYSKTNSIWSDAGTHESLGYLNHFLYQKEHGIIQQ